MRRTPAAFLAALTLAAAPAFAGIADSPLPVLVPGETTLHLYSVPGVINHYVGSLDLATFFSCTSTDTVTMQVGVETFDRLGSQVLAASPSCSLSVNPGATVIFGTSAAVGVPVDLNLATCSGLSGRGSARILATSKKLACTVFIADIVNAPPTSAWQLTIIAKLKQKAAN